VERRANELGVDVLRAGATYAETQGARQSDRRREAGESFMVSKAF